MTAIRTKKEYIAAMREAQAFIANEPAPGTPEGDRFEALVNMINAYDGPHNLLEFRDVILENAKRESQERSRELVRSGARTQESMFLIAPSIVKTLKIRHRGNI